MTDDTNSDDGRVNPSTDADGFEEITQAVEWFDATGLDKYPRVNVHATIECVRAHYEGTLTRFRKATTNDGTSEVNGWFAKLNPEGDGHINVYASPSHGGPAALRVCDYTGRGALPTKRPIESVTLEIEQADPRCPNCDGDMVLGHSPEKDNSAMDGDGSRGRWVGGLLCPECFPGRVQEDGEKGLP